MAGALSAAPVFLCTCRACLPGGVPFFFFCSRSFSLCHGSCPDLWGKEIFVGAQKQSIKIEASWPASCQAFTFGLPSATSLHGGGGSERAPCSPWPSQCPSAAPRCPGIPARSQPQHGVRNALSHHRLVAGPLPRPCLRNCLSCDFLPASSYFVPSRDTWILSVQTTNTIEKKLCLIYLCGCNWLLYWQGL